MQLEASATALLAVVMVRNGGSLYTTSMCVHTSVSLAYFGLQLVLSGFKTCIAVLVSYS